MAPYRPEVIGTPKRKKVKIPRASRRIRKNILADPNGSALEQLPPQKRAYVEAKVAGATNRAASEAAGVSKGMGSLYNHQADVQAAFRELVRDALPAEKLVGLISGGATATMPEYDSKGKKSRVPDWKTRRPYIQMAAEQAGYIETKENSSGAVIQVNVTHVGASSGEAAELQHTVTAQAK